MNSKRFLKRKSYRKSNRKSYRKSNRKSYRKSNRKSYRKSYRKSKIFKKGGAQYNETFLECYNSNLVKIQDAIKKYSGKHEIINKQALNFIENQLTPARKQAAHDLIENTIYMPFNVVEDIIEKLIINVYKNFNKDMNIYLYTGEKSKSNFMFAILALQYIRKNGLKEPIKFIGSFNNEIFDEIGDSPIILVDDVAYSGSQLGTQMSNIYYERVKTLTKSPPNIFILLTALNTFSKEKLSKVPTLRQKFRNVESPPVDIEFGKSPFKLIYLEEYLFTPLIIKLGIQRYFNLNVFFSLYTTNTPYISLYLDYKIADEASSYKNVLTYGQIVPENYNYRNIIEKHLDFVYGIFPKIDLFNPGEYDKLLNDFKNENGGTFFLDSKSYKSYKFVVKLLENLEKTDVFTSDKVTTSKFYPFINTCMHDEKILENIADEKIQSLDYSFFMAPKGCIADNDNCITTASFPNLIFSEIIKEKSLDKEEIIRLSDKINSVNCPLTWYKRGEFKMDC